MAIVGNAGKGRSTKQWNEVVKEDLKKCGLDRGLAKERERWKAQVMGKCPKCASTNKGRKTRRERRTNISQYQEIKFGI